MWRKFCAFALKISGWKIDGTLPPEDKCIILGAPHTTIWDFVVAYLYYHAIGGNCKCMVKKQMFIPPIGWIVRAMGGFPVDRTNATQLVRSVIHEIEKSDKFTLAIAPEGTRKPVKKWKTGFHIIAKNTGIPVYLAYFNWGNKHVGIFDKFEISDNAAEDMKKIQAIYEEQHLVGKNPEGYITH